MSDNVVHAFSEDHVVRLTGLSRGQLRAWDRSGFFQPHYAYENRQSAYSRIYSFRDVVGLRTVAVLMKQHRVSLQQLKNVAAELVRRGYEHWVDLKLFVVKGQVHFRRPASKDIEGVWDGQLAIVDVVDVISDIEGRVRDLQRRTADQYGHVIRNAPVVAGTRIPTAAIRRFHEAGYSVEQIIREYPSLAPKDVEAALEYEERLARRA
jgi:DNA-binding transcriptional MerR regulator